MSEIFAVGQRVRVRNWNSKKPERRKVAPAVYERGQRITEAKLREAIASFNGHAPTLQELGDMFGVSRERIRQRFVRLGIPRINAATANAPYKCTQCGKAIHTASQARIKSGFCIRCKPKLRQTVILTIICGQCKKPFDLPQSQYNARMRHTTSSGLRTTPRTWPLLCTRKCSGGYLGSHHRHPRQDFCKRGHRKEGTTPVERHCKLCQQLTDKVRNTARKAAQRVQEYALVD